MNALIEKANLSKSFEKKLKLWLEPVEGGSPELFLVGGAVRDKQLGRAPGDMDLVCRDPEGFARRLAAAHEAVVVPFEKKISEPCYRVVEKKDPSNHLDITPIKGGSLMSDLGKRDFTVNAMAIPIVQGRLLKELLDPFKGAEDIKRRLIRMTAPEAFVDDPLRILRAFRFSAELGFNIESTTLNIMKKEAQKLETSAAERVFSEIMRIFNSPRSTPLTRLMDDTGVLEVILPEIQAMKGCAQNSFHHKDVWGHSLLVLENCEYMLSHLETSFSDVASVVKDNLAQGNRLPVLKLSALLHDVGKPQTRGINDQTGRITFYGHDEQGAEIISAMGRKLKMPNSDRRLLSRLVREHLHVLNLSNPELKKTTRLKWFRKLRDDAVPAILLGMADIKGTLGPDSNEKQITEQLQWSREAIKDYYGHIKKELERQSLLTGKDLLELGMPAGPEMGKILKAVREAQDTGLVANRKEALKLAKEMIGSLSE